MPLRPGGITAIEIVPVGSALISENQLHRYHLTRDWDHLRPPATFIMLNPSTADHTSDDPTIRRCTRFARALGCGGLVVVNLYAYRATDPDDLFNPELPDADRIGLLNDSHIEAAALRAHHDGAPLIAAWGTRAEPGRVRQVLALPGMDRLTALAVTKAGHPGHPLYLPASARPKPWTPPAGYAPST